MGCHDMALASRHIGCRAIGVGVATWNWRRDTGERLGCRDKATSVETEKPHCGLKGGRDMGMDVATWLGF